MAGAGHGIEPSPKAGIKVVLAVGRTAPGTMPAARRIYAGFRHNYGCSLIELPESSRLESAGAAFTSPVQALHVQGRNSLPRPGPPAGVFFVTGPTGNTDMRPIVDCELLGHVRHAAPSSPMACHSFEGIGSSCTGPGRQCCRGHERRRRRAADTDHRHRDGGHEERPHHRARQRARIVAAGPRAPLRSVFIRANLPASDAVGLPVDRRKRRKSQACSEAGRDLVLGATRIAIEAQNCR